LNKRTPWESLSGMTHMVLGFVSFLARMHGGVLALFASLLWVEVLLLVHFFALIPRTILKVIKGVRSAS